MPSANQPPDTSSSSPDSALSTQHSALVLEGVLRDGLRVAAQFTELPWVREQFRRKLGLDVWPGTVNLQVDSAAGQAVLARLRLPPGAPGSVCGGFPVDPPGAPPPGGADAAGTPASPERAAFCVGYCFPARIGDVPAAVVIPHVPDYPADKLELVAPVRVRDALGLQPGDRVVVTVLAETDALTPTPLPRGEGLSGPINRLAASPLSVGEGGGEEAPR
jgi:riboflavin kinase, archaea type